MLTVKNYIGIGLIVILFIVCTFMSFAVPAYSIYNIVNTYKVDKLDKEYETALIVYTSLGRKGTFVYNFKIPNDEKTYRKNYFGSPSFEEKFLYVKFNENKTYWIIKDKITREYISDAIMILLAGLFVYIAIVLFRVILNIRYYI